MNEKATAPECVAAPELPSDSREIIALAHSHIQEAKRKQMRSTAFIHWVDLTAVSPLEAEEVATRVDDLMDHARVILSEEGYTVSYNSNPHGEERPLPTMNDVCFYTTKMAINW